MSITDLADSSWSVSLVTVVPWDFTIQHIALVLIEFFCVGCILIIFLAFVQDRLNAQRLAYKCCIESVSDVA